MKQFMIVSIENRKMPLVKLHNDVVQAYCDYHGYKYIFISEYKSNLPVYWWKIEFILNLMKKYPTINYFLWMDTDSIILNHFISLESICYNDKDLYISREVRNNGTEFRPYNAGIFMVKNSKMGMHFLKECIDTFLYSYCKGDLIGSWAGYCYEQGMLNIKIDKKYKSITSEIHPSVFLSSDIDISPFKDQFIWHLYIKDKNTVFIIFNYYINSNYFYIPNNLSLRNDLSLPNDLSFRNDLSLRNYF